MKAEDIQTEIVLTQEAPTFLLGGKVTLASKEALRIPARGPQNERRKWISITNYTAGINLRVRVPIDPRLTTAAGEPTNEGGLVWEQSNWIEFTDAEVLIENTHASSSMVIGITQAFYRKL